MVTKQAPERGPRFPAVPLAQINRRAGKHNGIVRDILTDLARLDEYSAIKVDLAQVGKKKADLRAALHRAAKKEKVQLATSSDERYLYIFRSSTKTEIKNSRPPALTCLRQFLRTENGDRAYSSVPASHPALKQAQ